MRYTAEDFANAIGGFRREIAGMVRRMVVQLTPGSVWQMVGHVLFDTTTQEAPDCEVYPGIGIFARPPSSGSPEGIVLNVAGPNQPAVVATRDEKTRAACVDDIAADETVAYNSTARVYVKANTTIEARAHGGVAVTIAKNADLVTLTNNLSTVIAAIIACVPTGVETGLNGLKTAITSAFPVMPLVDPAGTTVFKAQ